MALQRWSECCCADKSDTGRFVLWEDVKELVEAAQWFAEFTEVGNLERLAKAAYALGKSK